MRLIEFCQQMSDFAYQKESERGKILEQKTDFLFKWLTLIVSIIGIAVPIISKNTAMNVYSIPFIVLYAIGMLFLIAAMILILIVHFPRKIKLYELGTDYLQLLVNDEQLCDEREMEYHKILVDDVIIKDMRKMNQISAIIIMIAEICIIIGLLVSSILFAYLIWGV